MEGVLVTKQGLKEFQQYTLSPPQAHNVKRLSDYLAVQLNLCTMDYIYICADSANNATGKVANTNPDYHMIAAL